MGRRWLALVFRPGGPITEHLQTFTCFRFRACYPDHAWSVRSRMVGKRACADQAPEGLLIASGLYMLNAYCFWVPSLAI